MSMHFHSLFSFLFCVCMIWSCASVLLKISPGYLSGPPKVESRRHQHKFWRKRYFYIDTPRTIGKIWKSRCEIRTIKKYEDCCNSVLFAQCKHIIEFPHLKRNESVIKREEDRGIHWTCEQYNWKEFLHCEKERHKDQTKSLDFLESSKFEPNFRQLPQI